eukprot:scaffold120725_cov63-Phaeocystis_antarctica.AAC.3
MLRGVSSNTSEHSISKLLRDYGDVQIRLQTERGHCYVDFGSLELAQAFVEANLDDFEVRQHAHTGHGPLPWPPGADAPASWLRYAFGTSRPGPRERLRCGGAAHPKPHPTPT